MFERASAIKLRFDSCKGQLTTEDLWDAPLQSRDDFNLDAIAKGVNRHLKSLEEESFVNIKPCSFTSIYTLKLNILKKIINTKLELLKNKKDAAIKKEKKSKILEIIAKKQDSTLEGKSIEELEAELKDL